MPPRKRAKSSAPVTEVSTLWTCDSDHNVKAVAPDGDGNVFVATDICIYKLSGGEATVVAGGDEEGYVDGPNGKFNDISGLAVGTDGCLIVSEGDGDYGCIRKVALDGHISTLAGDPGGETGYEDGQPLSLVRPPCHVRGGGTSGKSAVCPSAVACFDARACAVI